MPGASSKANAAEIDRLALALAKEPGSKAFIPLAEEYGKAGMWQEAAAVLEDGLKTYPNFITAMVALGRVYDQLNQPVKAKALLEEAVKISPENLRAHRTLAKIYAIEGAAGDALRSCQVILAVNPQDEEALALRASLGSSRHTGSGPVPEPPADSVATPEAPHVLSDTQTAPLVEAREDDATPPVAVSAAGTTSAGRPPAAVVHLKRWLNTIQARRRDRDASHRSASAS